MAPADRPRVLVVDDDPVIVRLLEVNFRLEGFDVASASRGDTAADAAAEALPDVAIVDVTLPGLDGYSVVEQLRAMPGLEGLPAFVLSARSQDEDRERSEAIGATYVTKPFDPAELVDLARKAIGESSGGPAEAAAEAPRDGASGSIEDRLIAWLRLAVAAVAGGESADVPPEPELLTPKQKQHGDFATNVALALAPRLNRVPREVAADIVATLPDAPFVERVEVAGPGFVNIWVTDTWLHDALREIAARGADYGRAPPTGRRVQVEFVSANPTGPLTLGHARNAAIGDAVARLLEVTGWAVEREYYFNDAGGQMDRFGASVEARYLQLLGRQAEVPEDGYHGAYIEELAGEILEAEGPELADLEPDERLVRLRSEGADRVLVWIRRSLDRFGVRFDIFFSEASLAAKGEISEAVERLRAAGHAYEAEGAMWFRSTDFGDDKDRVLIRSNGAHTYFAADCAYILDKYARGYDRLIYVLGADHHGDVARLRGAAEALGQDPAAMEILIYQWVSFLRGGEPVPMSKRAGSFISLDELIDEVGADAARFTLLMSSTDQTMRFDIDVVKRQSMENPVYYVQYGHARIASILRKAESDGIELRPIAEADLGLLATEAEQDLLRALADIPGQLAVAAELRAPHRLTHLAQDVAGRVHRFYTECRVVSDDAALTQARLWLCAGTKRVLANLLGLVGVSAPESMSRDVGEAAP